MVIKFYLATFVLVIWENVVAAVSWCDWWENFLTGQVHCKYFKQNDVQRCIFKLVLFILGTEKDVQKNVRLLGPFDMCLTVYDIYLMLLVQDNWCRCIIHVNTCVWQCMKYILHSWFRTTDVGVWHMWIPVSDSVLTLHLAPGSEPPL